MALKFDKYFTLFFIIPWAFDRASKYCIMQNIWHSQKICSFLNVYKAYNHGIAWGIGNGLEQNQTSILTVFIAGVLCYFFWFMHTQIKNNITQTACLLILAGGVSNFMDRLQYGNVIDFIQLHHGDLYFPVFNFADVYITIGAALLMYIIFFDDENK
jgi:signal peptidase II